MRPNPIPNAKTPSRHWTRPSVDGWMVRPATSRGTLHGQLRVSVGRLSTCWLGGKTGLGAPWPRARHSPAMSAPDTKGLVLEVVCAESFWEGHQLTTGWTAQSAHPWGTRSSDWLRGACQGGQWAVFCIRAGDAYLKDGYVGCLRGCWSYHDVRLRDTLG